MTNWRTGCFTRSLFPSKSPPRLKKQRRTECRNLSFEMARFFSILAAIGLLLSLVVDLWAFFADPEERLPYVWLLNVGIFVVLIAAAVLSNLNPPPHSDPHFAKYQPPRWLAALLLLLLTNAFLTSLFSPDDVPEVQNDRFVMASHGRVIRELSAEEYHRQRAYALRASLGISMLLYSLSILMLHMAMYATRPDQLSSAMGRQGQWHRRISAHRRSPPMRRCGG